MCVQTLVPCSFQGGVGSLARSGLLKQTHLTCHGVPRDPGVGGAENGERKRPSSPQARHLEDYYFTFAVFTFGVCFFSLSLKIERRDGEKEEKNLFLGDIFFFFLLPHPSFSSIPVTTLILPPLSGPRYGCWVTIQTEGEEGNSSVIDFFLLVRSNLFVQSSPHCPRTSLHKRERPLLHSF
ncbi:hypothetical protein CEXT_24101 [Caerostris extrusa]|uniref:Uncharacterized protein n=1 Tax=Caerostris extrusa TaxID=172846 RepID=A0AAV4SJD6_CAEEX|nr:hypothetical protein CEXT_24101 [Caerostris extrusa]